MSQSGMPVGVPPPPPQWSALPPSTSISVPWSALVNWGRMVGFLLIFVGTLVVVGFGSWPGGCVGSTSCTGWYSGYANAVLAGKLLWVIGLAFIGGASGIRLNRRWGGKDGGSNEDPAAWVQRHKANVLIVIVSIILLLLIVFTINLLPIVIFR